MADPQFTYVSPDDLLFDPDNPRFGGAAQGKNQDEILELLIKSPHNAEELIDSLLENGFIDYEPLVVRKNGRQYTVVEGNRRLAAVKKILANKDQYKGRIDDLARIPVIVFPEQPDLPQQQEMRVYLGVKHLFGFREWPPGSKASFLDQHIKSKSDVERAVKELGIEKAEIRRYLVPYRVMAKAQDLVSKIPDDQDFWVLGEALARTGTKKYIGLQVNPDSLEVISFEKAKLRHLLAFLYGVPEDGKKKNVSDVKRRITETRDLSRLSKVLASKKASEALEKGKTLDEASLFVETREESIGTLEKLMGSLRLLLKKVLALRATSTDAKAVLTRFESFESAVKTFISNANR